LIEVIRKLAGIIPSEWPPDSGEPVTSAYLIFSFRDVDASENPGGGQQIYVDDWSFKIDAPEPEPEPIELKFTVVVYNAEAGEVVLNWTSSPGETLTLSSSDNLQDWSEREDGIEAGADGVTSFTDGNLEAATVRYYQVRREEG
jgi:hypothetical protein